MTIAMDELDLAFLTPTDAPIWEPLGSDGIVGWDGELQFPLADAGWNAVATELEKDLVWAEVVALLEADRWRDLYR